MRVSPVGFLPVSMATTLSFPSTRECYTLEKTAVITSHEDTAGKGCRLRCWSGFVSVGYELGTLEDLSQALNKPPTWRAKHGHNHFKTTVGMRRTTERDRRGGAEMETEPESYPVVHMLSARLRKGRWCFRNLEEMCRDGQHDFLQAGWSLLHPHSQEETLGRETPIFRAVFCW